MKLPVIKEEPKDKCGCGAEAGELDSCPYTSEIYGREEECNCCDDCRYQCAQDI